MTAIIKSSAKVLAVVGLAVGMSAISFGQTKTSITNALNNAMTVQNTANHSSGGSTGGHSGGSTGGHSGGSTGGHNGGGGGTPPNCVPEPASMLILGAGAGLMALKRRRKA